MTSSAAGRALPTEKAVVAVAAGDPTHEGEPHAGGGAGRLNWLRAGVLGANDGIVSVAGIVVGVAGATAARADLYGRFGWSGRRGGVHGVG